MVDNMLLSQKKLNKQTQLFKFQYFQETNNNFKCQVNIVENLLQLVSDPNVEFEEDHESVQEMLRLIERLPTAMESSNINRIMEELNGSGQRRYDSGPDIDGAIGRRDGDDPEPFGQLTTAHPEPDTDISGMSRNKV